MVKLNDARGWLKAGSHPSLYEMGVEPELRYGEWKAACIRSKAKSVDGFGTLMQNCKAAAYIGQRLRFSAQVQAEDVKDWAGLWLRIDGVRDAGILGFDNMQDRAVRGTCAWAKHAVVLDVPAGSSALAYGVLLSGVGRVWISEVRLEPVGIDVPTTNLNMDCSVRDAPENLDFSN